MSNQENTLPKGEIADTTANETAYDPADKEIYAPPAHIAARFYRARMNRRKSSAASSRRNSLSSAHSHASTHSRSRGPAPGSGFQSNYIAQHLRRASIIETRKARLADRAAHAEQVRLRAALVKATPRGNLSISEERALAAQLAKEKYLAKVTATCAEEVARAKRIAEEVKERKIAEEARVRLEMEERHAEAERRRTDFQRNIQARRARRASSTEKKLPVVEEVADADADVDLDVVLEEVDERLWDDASAASRIQSSWRLHRRKAPVKNFRGLGLTAQSSKSSTFEEVTAIVADPGVISSTTAILTHLGLQEANDANAALNTKTFLSAYLIIGHPISVLLNQTGAQEQDLIAKAADLINLFEIAVARLDSWNRYSPNPSQLETLSQSYTAFTSAFAAWRLQDSSVLIEGMVESFVELDAIWQTVKDDSRGDVASDFRQGIRDNQVILLSQIRKLAGPDRADVLIKKAIRESRRRRPKKRATAEVRPRGIESAPPGTSAVSAQAVEEVAIPSEPLRSGALTQLFTPMPTNRVLTHELAISKDYRLEDSTASSAMRDQLYRSICDSMKAGFEAGEGAAWTVSAAENVKGKLLRTLKAGNSMHTLISETLDLDDIHRQCQQGVFSYAGFFDFMANILPKLCAPFRDQELSRLAEDLRADANGDELGTMIEKLFKLLRMVDVLSLDYTNFMIMNAAPSLIKEAPGYEHRQFAKDMESGVVTLEGMKRWWVNTRTVLVNEADRRDPEGARNPSDRPSFQKTYTQGLVETAICSGGINSAAIPETLQMDAARIKELRAQAIRIAVIGAILLTTKNLLKRDSRSQWKNEATRLWQLLATDDYERADSTPEDPTPVQKVFSIIETAHNMPPATKQSVLAAVERFFAQAADATASGVKFSDPVLKLLFQRLKTHILTRLLAESAADRVRAASSASEMLAASGMAEFATHVTSMVEVLEAVRKVDWESHGMWYQQVSRDL